MRYESKKFSNKKFHVTKFVYVKKISGRFEADFFEIG